MIGYHAVTESGTKRFTTPFAAMGYLNQRKVAGRVEAESADGTRTMVCERLSDGGWSEGET